MLHGARVVRLTRRRFLDLGLKGGALLGLGSIAACAEDGLLFPDPTYKIWIAENLHGQVHIPMITSYVPVSGATVWFQAGLERDAWITLGTTTSGIGGEYEMSASESPGGRAGFWRFGMDTPPEQDVTVHCRVIAAKDNLYGEYGFKLLRSAMRELPPPSQVFFLNYNVQVFPTA